VVISPRSGQALPDGGPLRTRDTPTLALRTHRPAAPRDAPRGDDHPHRRHEPLHSRKQATKAKRLLRPWIPDLPGTEGATSKASGPRDNAAQTGTRVCEVTGETANQAGHCGHPTRDSEVVELG
jgi:hypothetical protein